MIHIASEEFYTDIYNDMQNLIGQEYVFFYEGVKPGSEESLRKLSTLMGIEVSPTMYDTVAKMADVSLQDTDDFLGIIPSINVDLTSDEIIELAEKNTIPAATIDTTTLEKIEKMLPNFNDNQRKIVRILGRSMITLLVRSYTDPALQKTLYAQMPIMQIIIDGRNRYLADTIIASPAKNIYIHYGAMHYNGVLTLLQRQDARWKEVARSELSVLR